MSSSILCCRLETAVTFPVRPFRQALAPHNGLELIPLLRYGLFLSPKLAQFKALAVRSHLHLLEKARAEAVVEELVVGVAMASGSSGSQFTGDRRVFRSELGSGFSGVAVGFSG